MDGWAADTTAGTEVAVLAWRRANVAELNAKARVWMAATGRLTTVHRFQGSTVERNHLHADGGGRELAYVATSRARQAGTEPGRWASGTGL